MIDLLFEISTLLRQEEMNKNSFRYIVSLIDIISSIYTLRIGISFGTDVLHLGWASILFCSLSLILIVSSLLIKFVYSNLLFISGAFMATIPSVSKIATFFAFNGSQQSIDILSVDSYSLHSFSLDFLLLAINTIAIAIYIRIYYKLTRRAR